MKKTLVTVSTFVIPIMLLVTLLVYGNYHVTTIMTVQYVPPESLAIGHDKSLLVGDSITIVGRVVAPPRVNFSGGDYRALLRGSNQRMAYIQDTSNVLWGGVIVRQGDTVHNTLFDQIDSGMKIQVNGIVSEYSVGGTPETSTQIALDTLSQIQILPTIKRRPPPINVTVSDFDSMGTVKFTTAEQYEGSYVQLTNLTMGPQSNSGQRHIRSLLDAQGNKIYLRDFSNFYSTSPSPSWGWTAWNPPPVGATVASIRGVIIEGAYQDGTFNGLATYPYVICPVYPNDLTMGNTPPIVNTVTRYPGVPKPTDTVFVTANIVDSLAKFNKESVASAQLFYRINKTTYNTLSMTPSSNVYWATIPMESLGTLVEYFVKVVDNQGAVTFSPSDTSRSTYFYYPRTSDTMTIKDIQYTPNNGGYSGYNGDTVSTEGVVTADTSDIHNFTFIGPGGTQSSPRRVIIQDPNIQGGWSGIWISGNATDPLVKGQKVMVTGVVTEINDVTSIVIGSSSNISIISSGNPQPAAAQITPGVLADTKTWGDTTAQKWQSVVISYPGQVVITCINASSSTACTSTLPLPDTSFRRNYGEMLAIYNSENIPSRIKLQQGGNTFTNGWDSSKANWYHPNYPGQLLHNWDGINGLTGIGFFDFGQYQIVPRKNDDFGSVIGVKPITETPSLFWLRQNYPNPFNPETQIDYNLPTDAEVTLKVYNMLGQQVRVLIDGIQVRGKYDITFDGTNLASGLYIYVLDVNGFEGHHFRGVKKMVLVK